MLSENSNRGVSASSGAISTSLMPIPELSSAAPIQIAGSGEGEVGQGPRADQSSSAGLANSIAEIREQWRRRQAWHRAEKSLTLQAKALCRRLAGGDKKDADRLYSAALGKGNHDLAEIAFAAIFPLTEGAG